MRKRPPRVPGPGPLQEAFLDSMFIFLRLGKTPPSCYFLGKAGIGKGGGPFWERAPSPPPPKAFDLIEFLMTFCPAWRPTFQSDKNTLKPAGRQRVKKDNSGRPQTGIRYCQNFCRRGRAALADLGEELFVKSASPSLLYSIQFAARPTARCQLWSSSARRSSGMSGSKRRSSFHRAHTSSSPSQKPTASPAR